MNTYPLEMIEGPDRTTMLLPAGYTEIDYFFTTVDSAVQPSQPTEVAAEDNSVILGVGGVIAAVVIAAIVIKARKKSVRIEAKQDTVTKSQFNLESVQKIKPLKS